MLEFRRNESSMDNCSANTRHSFGKFFLKYVYNNNYNIQRYKFGLTRAMMSKRNFMQIYI